MLRLQYFCSTASLEIALDVSFQKVTAVNAVLLGLAIQFSKSELLEPHPGFPRGRGFYAKHVFEVKGLNSAPKPTLQTTGPDCEIPQASPSRTAKGRRIYGSKALLSTTPCRFLRQRMFCV